MAEEAQPQSFVCDVCGIKLRDSGAVQIHAAKSEHQSFSESVEEIKPLTEEEKRAKLQDLRDKLAAKRKAEAAQELEFGKKNAAIERKKTQESAQVMEDLQRKEDLKAIAAKRREKEEDLKAKQRVKAQLEQDKKDRAARAAAEKAARMGTLPPPATTTSAAEKSSTPARNIERSEAKLQIRHAAGKPIVRTWGKQVTLLQVAKDIYTETNVVPENAVFKMFGKVIRGADLDKSLLDLELVPSASLQLS